MYDLKIINAFTVLEEPIEIAIHNQKIVKVEPIISESAVEVIDAKGQYVSAGWIDAHVHCYEKMNLYYDYPDEIGVKTGVTTIVDAGSSGESNIKDFYELAKYAKTNVYALMNISKYGIVEQDELADLSKINEDKNISRISELSDFIIGIKARMSKTVVGENNIVPLKMAKKLQSHFDNLPLMVHIGSAPPKLENVLDRLESGDIVTHCYNGKPNGILDEDGEIKNFVTKAYERGVIFDIGHGTDSFNFEVAKKAITKEFYCETISTDIYHRNRKNGPVYDLATTLDKMLAIGFDMETIIKMVTENPAKMYHLENKGQLAVGFDADLTIFSVEDIDKELMDSNGNKLTGNQVIIPLGCLVAGNFYSVGGDNGNDNL